MSFAEQIEFLPSIEPTTCNAIKAAVSALRDGKVVLLLDDSARENEGDLVIAAEKITPESMNFLIKQGSGVVCLAMPRQKLEALNLPLMVHDNTNFFNTAFTISIEASSGVTTGVSAKDRAHTIRVAIDDNAQAKDLARPGHVFPLAAKQNGVFDRMGHTEGSVDLMKIAKLRPGAVLCELMNADGSMTTGEARLSFAHKLGIPVVSVEDIFFHRVKTENIVEKTSCKPVTSRFGKLFWQRFNFASSIQIDVFTKEAAVPLENGYAKISLATGDNLVSRMLAHVLEQTEDDPLVQSLQKLVSGQCDVALFATFPMLGDPQKDQQRNIYASICRILTDLKLNNIHFCESNDELSDIAQKHFVLNIRNAL